jgi:recombination protein RecT
MEKIAKTNEITELVIARVSELAKSGGLYTYPDYNAEAAIRSAALILTDTLDKNKQPVLQVCTRESVANALLDMVVQGLSPMKRQCYFVAYGNKLQLMRSYFGTITVAKRCGLKWIKANVIYAGDKIEFAIDETGRRKLIKHEQRLESLGTDIIGAYAVYEVDGRIDCEVMNIKQIRQAWAQGKTFGGQGETVHTKFPEEMAKKTVIARACKLIINAASDITVGITEIADEYTELEPNNEQATVIELTNADNEAAQPEAVAEEVMDKEVIQETKEEVSKEPKTPKIEQQQIPF